MNLLLIGDEPRCRRLARGLTSLDATIQRVADSQTMEKVLAVEAFHLACIDLAMKDASGEALLDLLHARVPALPIVVLLGSDDRCSTADLASRGVTAGLQAPFGFDRLRTELTAQALAEPLRSAAWKAPATTDAARSPRWIAHDDASKRALDTALRAAASDAAILILGETGAGKSLLARTIHQHSPLRRRPFVTVSCPSLNGELLESDLFGHVRGAFTGAIQDTWGKVAAAEGGTLFLDEIGDLPAALQPKLLRLLQEKQYERVGETVCRTARVRIIVATNRDLRKEVSAGRFREDLYYRVNVIALEAPPLRSRCRDIMAVAETFAEEICRQLGKPIVGFTLTARRLLENHAWPGNLRELRNVIERAAILATGTDLEESDFPSLLSTAAVSRHQIGAPVSLQCVEEAHIQMVVANSSSLEEAARILRIDKSTLYRKRKQMEARVAKFTPAFEVAATGS
ncbi:MAG: hypothetical protein RIQ93_2111 [Verrucomicrobiota bacterium]|jgi:NtrC-family two-component system response regulator AlgB